MSTILLQAALKAAEQTSKPEEALRLEAEVSTNFMLYVCPSSF
jgi:uncharacterized protein (DUF1778 family)